MKSILFNSFFVTGIYLAIIIISVFFENNTSPTLNIIHSILFLIIFFLFLYWPMYAIKQIIKKGFFQSDVYLIRVRYCLYYWLVNLGCFILFIIYKNIPSLTMEITIDDYLYNFIEQVYALSIILSFFYIMFAAAKTLVHVENHNKTDYFKLAITFMMFCHLPFCVFFLERRIKALKPQKIK
jgi:hypothetical protein